MLLQVHPDRGRRLQTSCCNSSPHGCLSKPTASRWQAAPNPHSCQCFPTASRASTPPQHLAPHPRCEGDASQPASQPPPKAGPLANPARPLLVSPTWSRKRATSSPRQTAATKMSCSSVGGAPARYSSSSAAAGDRQRRRVSAGPELSARDARPCQKPRPAGQMGERVGGSPPAAQLQWRRQIKRRTPHMAPKRGNVLPHPWCPPRPTPGSQSLGTALAGRHLRRHRRHQCARGRAGCRRCWPLQGVPQPVTVRDGLSRC